MGPITTCCSHCWAAASAALTSITIFNNSNCMLFVGTSFHVMVFGPWHALPGTRRTPHTMYIWCQTPSEPACVFSIDVIVEKGHATDCSSFAACKQVAKKKHVLSSSEVVTSSRSLCGPLHLAEVSCGRLNQLLRPPAVAGDGDCVQRLDGCDSHGLQQMLLT